MNADKYEVQLLLLDADQEKRLSDEDRKVLRNCGYEAVFIPNPHKAIRGVPITPIVMNGDIITQCLLRSVYSNEDTQKLFGKLMIYSTYHGSLPPDENAKIHTDWRKK